MYPSQVSDNIGVCLRAIPRETFKEIKKLLEQGKKVFIRKVVLTCATCKHFDKSIEMSSGFSKSDQRSYVDIDNDSGLCKVLKINGVMNADGRRHGVRSNSVACRYYDRR